MSMPFIRALLLLACLPFCASAQKYLALQYRTAEGLPSNQVRDMIVGEHGFLWVATDGGLARFDGETFQTYERALDSYYIKALARDTAGRILFVNDSGCYRLSHRGPAGPQRPDTAFLQRLATALPLPTDTALYYPNDLYVDAQNRHWASQPDGRLVRITGRGLQFYPLSPPFAEGDSQAGFTFSESPAGTLVVGSTAGELFRYHEARDEFQQLPTPPSLSSIRCLYWQGATLLAGGNGLYRCTFTNGQPGQWQAGRLEGRTATSLAAGNAANRLLVGTAEAGLWQATWQQNQWKLKAIYGANDPHRINELPFRSIHQIYRGPHGNIWLGTGQGLGLLQARFFETVFGLANNNTLATLPLPEGEVLISYGDVFAIQAREGAFFAEALPSLDQGLITALAYADGGLFLGTTTGSLLRYRGARLKRDLGLEDRGGGLFFLEAGPDGSIWICQAPDENPIVGVGRRHKDGTFQDYGAAQGLESRILVVKESPQGRLYAAGIGPGTYLYRYLPGEDRFINLSLPLPFAHSAAFEVHDMAIDNRGIIWLATTDGLLRYDLERVQRTTLGPYTSTEIRAVAAMQDGRLWLSTSTEGLLYYEEESQSYTVFDLDSGLPSTVGAYRCLSRSQDGRIWVGTAEGTVYSRDLRPTPLPTQAPKFMQIRSGRKILAPEAEAPLRLKPQAQLSLHWACPTFPAGRVTYRYRLRGTPDSSWVQLGTDNSLALDELPPGPATLELEARKPGGHTWSPPLLLSLKVQLPWYKRWWAIALGVAIALAALYGFVSQVAARLIRYIRVLKERVRLRDQTIQEQRNLLAEQSAGLAQQESDLQVMSARQPEHAARSLPLAFLHHCTAALQPGAGWAAALEMLESAATYHAACDCWEIGWYDAEELHSIQFTTTAGQPELQTVPFDEKNNLLAWLLVYGDPQLLNRYSREYAPLISLDAPPPFESVLGVKGEVPGKQPFAIVFSAHRPDAFTPADLQTAELLVQYLALLIRQPLDTKSLRL